jgi:peptidyl-tRNA hydrolase
MAAHAILASFIKAGSDAQSAFLGDDAGTKVVLAAPDEGTLWQAYRRSSDAGLPCHLWLEDGEPTALGIGPADRSRIKPITQRFKLYGAAPPAKGGELNLAHRATKPPRWATADDVLRLFRAAPPP